MTYEPDQGEISPDNDKHSKRDRFRDALTRTKSKFRKEKASSSQEDFKLSDDVNDFLAAGRQSTSSRPAIIDHSPFESLPTGHHLSDQQHGRPPSRGALVPKIDVSQSQRWPNARSIETDPQGANHLQPGSRVRSQSFGALGKKKPRPRGLSVSFDDAPPVIIGEGGDEATTPPNEISKARQRARSLSPVQLQPSNLPPKPPGGRSPVRRKPVSPLASPSVQEQDDFVPRPVRRVQTGLKEDDQPKLSAASALERQLQKALVLDQESSTYFGQPPRVQQPASYVVQQAARLDTIKPMARNTDAMPQRQHYGGFQPQTAPPALAHQADPAYRNIPSHAMNNEFTRPPPSSLDARPSYKHQQMQQPPPGGWI